MKCFAVLDNYQPEKYNQEERKQLFLLNVVASDGWFPNVVRLLCVGNSVYLHRKWDWADYLQQMKVRLPPKIYDAVHEALAKLSNKIE
jgi:hypothetical protein